jgi:NADPH2:quinone reductase
VLVHAAAGGVGLAACQIAKVLGAKVIACVGSPAKGKIATEKGGADYVVDVVYDPVGMLVPSLKCIAWNGRLVVVGFVAGTIEKVPANLVLLKNCSIVGLFWGATAREYGEEARQSQE